MPTCERCLVFPVAFETVWEFYDGVEELTVLTPDWTGMSVSHAVGPDGEPDPDGYRVGTEVHLELQPLGIGWVPESEWVVEIVEREVATDRARFVDEQIGDRGPYDTWRHIHQFVDLGEETLVRDRIEYRVPSAGNLPLASPLLAGMLWYRHRRTRALLAE